MICFKILEPVMTLQCHDAFKEDTPNDSTVTDTMEREKKTIFARNKLRSCPDSEVAAVCFHCLWFENGKREKEQINKWKFDSKIIHRE